MDRYSYILAVLMLFAWHALAQTPCRCHWGRVPTNHIVKHDGKIQLVAPPRITVSTNVPPGSKTYDLKKNKATDLGVHCMANLTGLSFEVKAQDPDIDVCESGDGKVWAKVAGRSDAPVRVEIEGPTPGHVATVALTQINNHWTNSWKPSVVLPP